MTQTIIKQSTNVGGSHIVCGDVEHIHARTTWHSKDILFDVMFEHATAVISAQSLIRLMLKAREALINANITEGLSA